jgi:hypothetical protein
MAHQKGAIGGVTTMVRRCSGRQGAVPAARQAALRVGAAPRPAREEDQAW